VDRTGSSKRSLHVPALVLGFVLLSVGVRGEFVWIVAAGLALLFVGIALSIPRLKAMGRRTGTKVELDRTPWREFAEGMGLRILGERLPQIAGRYRGHAVRIDLVRRRRASTRVRVPLPAYLGARLGVHRAAGRLRTNIDRATGDVEFDEEFRVTCKSKSVAEKVVGEGVRAWIAALGDADVLVKGGTVQAIVPGYETDLDRLRGLLELAVEVAEAASG